MVNPTLLRAISNLMAKQSGKSVDEFIEEMPETGIRGTQLIGDWRQVAPDDERLIRTIEHILPKSERGKVSPAPTQADAARMMIIGQEGGTIPVTSPLIKEVLEKANVRLTDKEIAELAKQADEFPPFRNPELVKELRQITGDPNLAVKSQGLTRSGKVAVDMTPEERLAAAIEGGMDPTRGATISSSNVHEAFLRNLVDEGIPATKVRSPEMHDIPMGASEAAGRGQKRLEDAIRGLIKQEFEFEGGSGIQALRNTSRLGGAAKGGLGAASEMTQVRAMLGGVKDPKLRSALADIAYMRGGISPEIAESIKYGTMATMIPGGKSTYRTTKATEEMLAQQAEKMRRPENIGGVFERDKRYSRDDLVGEAYADDPSAIPIGRDRTPLKRQLTAKEQELVDRAKVDVIPEHAPIKTDDILPTESARDLKRRINEIMDVAEEADPIAATKRSMFDLKNKIGKQLDDLVESTRGINAPKREVKGIIDFREKVQDIKKQLEAAWKKQDFDKIVEIGHRIDEAN